VPFGEYIKTYCEQANCQNLHVWNSHRQHAARLFQTTPYDWVFLSNSLAICFNVTMQLLVFLFYCLWAYYNAVSEIALLVFFTVSAKTCQAVV